MHHVRPKISIDHKLDFNDVLIVPKQSQLSSRSQVNLNRKFIFKHSKQEWTGVPIISSNMDTVTNIDTFNVLKRKSYLSCFPKHLNKEWAHSNNIPTELKDTDWYMLSCGIGDQDLSKLSQVLKLLYADFGKPPKFLCVDVANGYMDDLVKKCQHIRYKIPEVTLIAGNVVTPEGVHELVKKGHVDIVKVGIGSGAVCTTRNITGIGYPQLSAILECAEAAHDIGAHIISDGGIVHEGDIAKAFCAGADFVMIGSMLAGHDVSPGESINENGKHYKMLYGMSSSVANSKYAGGLQWYKAPEGKVVKMPFKGCLTDTIQRVEGGLRSACTYLGAENIEQMYEFGNFIKVNHPYNTSLNSLVVSQ